MRKSNPWFHVAEIAIVVVGLIVVQVANAESLSADEIARSWQSILAYVLGRGTILLGRE